MGMWDDEDEANAEMAFGLMDLIDYGYDDCDCQSCRRIQGLCERCGADDDVQEFMGWIACPACRRDIEKEQAT